MLEHHTTNISVDGDGLTTGIGSTAVGSGAWPGTGGTTPGKNVAIIDWISYSNLAGATDENWKLQIADDNTVLIFETGQTVTGGTRDNLFLQFVHGFPLKNYYSGLMSNEPCYAATISVSGPAALTTGVLTVGFHLEPAARRHGYIYP